MISLEESFTVGLVPVWGAAEMTTKDSPHYLIEPAELARWLDEQGDESWWSIDGDPLLTGLLALPLPGPEIAEVLKDVPRQLLFLDKDQAAQGERIGADELDAHVSTDDDGLRVLQFSWDNRPQDWLLIEDTEIPELIEQHKAGAL